MNFSLVILLLTLIQPFLALALLKKISPRLRTKLLKPAFIFFVVHNLFYAFGFSIKGDYADYIIFSIEYFTFCLLLLSAPKNKYFLIRALRAITLTLILFVTFFCCLFFWILPAISNDYEADKIFYFESQGKNYETERFSFGTIGSIGIRYVFVTYREYCYLPFEKEINTTDFLDTETNLNVSEDSLQISIQHVNKRRQIIFTSTDGHSISKFID